MQRRDFLSAALAGAAAAWPLVAYAQQPNRVRRIGALMAFPEGDAFFQPFVTAFTEALAHFGWVEGRNLVVDYRYAAGNPELVGKYAVELVALAPDAILASTLPAVAAVQQQTHTIPIVFVLMPDPVGLGFVQSLAHPGDNLTGFSAFDTPVFEKWLQLLKEAAPDVAQVTVIFNPDFRAGPYIPLFKRAIETAGPPLGVTVTFAAVRDDATIDAAIAAAAREPGGAVITLPDPFLAIHHKEIIAATARYRLPLMGLADFFPREGALMSYGFDPIDRTRMRPRISIVFSEASVRPIFRCNSRPSSSWSST